MRDMYTVRTLNSINLPVFEAAVCNKNECCPGTEKDTCINETKEECLIAKPIHNIPRRITGYQTQDDEYPLCDQYITPGWYTFCGHVLSANRIGCGTVFNWIRTGALPEDGPDLVDVCLTIKEERACSEKSQVNASKCHDGTYVFYLVDTQSCPEAYCIESAVVNTNEDSMCTGKPNEQRCEGCCVNDGECLAIDGECVFNVSSDVGECRCRPGSVFRDETCSEENTAAELEDTSNLNLVLAINFVLYGGIAAVAIITCLTCRHRQKTASNTKDKIGVYDEIVHDTNTKMETGKTCEKTQYYQVLFVVEGSKDIYPTKGMSNEMNDDHVYTTI